MYSRSLLTFPGGPRASLPVWYHPASRLTWRVAAKYFSRTCTSEPARRLVWFVCEFLRAVAVDLLKLLTAYTYIVPLMVSRDGAAQDGDLTIGKTASHVQFFTSPCSTKQQI